LSTGKLAESLVIIYVDPIAIVALYALITAVFAEINPVIAVGAIIVAVTEFA